MLAMRDYPAAFRGRRRSARPRPGCTLRRGLRFRNATDGLIALRAGYPTVMLGSVNRYKLPDNYHWPTDSPDERRLLDDGGRGGAVRRSRAGPRRVTVGFQDLRGVPSGPARRSSAACGRRTARRWLERRAHLSTRVRVRVPVTDRTYRGHGGAATLAWTSSASGLEERHRDLGRGHRAPRPADASYVAGGVDLASTTAATRAVDDARPMGGWPSSRGPPWLRVTVDLDAERAPTAFARGCSGPRGLGRRARGAVRCEPSSVRRTACRVRGGVPRRVVSARSSRSTTRWRGSARGPHCLSERERLLARGDLAREARLGDLRQQLAELGAAGDAQLGRQLVAAHQRRLAGPRRAARAPRPAPGGRARGARRWPRRPCARAWPGGRRR